MALREIIAWAIIAGLLALAVFGIWYGATSRTRQRRRENRQFDRSAAARAERDDQG